VLRKIFGPKREEVTGGCRKLHNEDSFIICTLREMLLHCADGMGRTCSSHGGDGKYISQFLGNPKGRRNDLRDMNVERSVMLNGSKRKRIRACGLDSPGLNISTRGRFM
jgi:hypothetical protein